MSRSFDTQLRSLPLRTPDRAQVSAIIIERLQRLFERRGESLPQRPAETTVLIGSPEAVLDSLGWVQFVVDVEHEIEERFDAPGADSGFEAIDGLQVCTIGSLSDLVHDALLRRKE